MQLSAKKQKNLTYLEVQAQLMVNEDEDVPEVTDEERYEQMLEKRKDRRTVSSQQRYSLMSIIIYSYRNYFNRGSLYLISWKDKSSHR